MKRMALLATGVMLAGMQANAQTYEAGSDGTPAQYQFQDKPSHSPTYGSQAAQDDNSAFVSNLPIVQRAASGGQQDNGQPEQVSTIPASSAPSDGK